MAEDPRSLTDEALMRRLAAGRHDALALLYNRYAPILASLARRALDRATGEDIVQDVFLTVWRKADIFSPDRGMFRPWVLRIARHRILNELRTRRRRPLQGWDGQPAVDGLPDPRPQPDDLAWQVAMRADVRGAVQHLPTAQRRVLALAFFDELTDAEVAGRLRLPLGTAKTRIRAGLRTLRSALSALAPVGPAPAPHEPVVRRTCGRRGGRRAASPRPRVGGCAA